MNTWTVYDHPKDFPNSFVARRFEFDKPTGDFMVGGTLEQVRMGLSLLGLTRLDRHPTDDPVIVETWI